MFSYNSVCIFTGWKQNNVLVLCNKLCTSAVDRYFLFTLYTKNSGNTVYDLVTIFFCVSFFSTK